MACTHAAPGNGAPTFALRSLPLVAAARQSAANLSFPKQQRSHEPPLPPFLGRHFPTPFIIQSSSFILLLFLLLAAASRAPAQTSFGNALALNGLNQYLQIPPGIWFSNDLTIEAWVYQRNYVVGAPIVYFGNDPESQDVVFALNYEGVGGPVFIVYSNTIVNYVLKGSLVWLVPTNQWVHLAATLQGKVGTIYVNGIAVATDSAMPAPVAVNRTNDFIGRDPWGRSPNAIFDEVRIWSVARTAAQIQDDMGHPLSGTETNLLGYWKFDEEAGSMAYDATSGHNDGTLVNRPLRLPSRWVPILTVNGANPYTIECQQPFVDPGATVSACVLAAAGGDFHSLALNAGRTVVGWGTNSFGQTNSQPAATNVVAIAGRNNYNLALRADGTVFGWGGNDSGQTNVSAAASNVVAIAAGQYHCLALRADGTIAGWGDNSYSQATSPLNATNVVAIGAGEYFSVALRADGSVIGWGSDSYGETNCPVTTNVMAIASGFNHVLALRTDGSVIGWGRNYEGQISIPSGASSGVVAIAAGAHHSLALRADGTVMGWGNNNYGQANGIMAGSNVVAIGAGRWHSLAVRADGSVVGWGRDDSGQTDVPRGVGTVTMPVAIAGTVNTNTPGTYVLTYTATNAFGESASTNRLVVVEGLQVVTSPASGVTSAGATLNAIVFPGDAPSTAWFEWGLTTNYGNQTASIPVSTGTNAVPVNQLLTGLAPLTTYHFHVAATNSLSRAVGGDAIFRTFSTNGNPAATTSWGWALSFNAALGQWVAAVAPDLPLNSSPFTVEAWINPSSMNSGGIVAWGDYRDNEYSWDNVNVLALTADGLENHGVESAWWTDGLTATTGPLTGAWHHVAATYDGTSRRLLLDGVTIASDIPGSSSYASSPSNFTIGKSGTSDYFDGQIDEVRIWGVGRTDSQIASTMYQRLTGTEPYLLAYWRFDEGAGTTTFDSTTNGYTGVLTNGPTWTNSTVPTVAPDTWGNALYFDGAISSVSLGSNGPVLGTNFTEEAWINPLISDTNFHGILGYGPDHTTTNDTAARFRAPSLFVWGGTKLMAGFGDGTNWNYCVTDNVLTNDAWIHVAATYDGFIYRVYVNGQLVPSTNYVWGSATNFAGAVPYTNPVCQIGEVAGYYFLGQIDEVRIWGVTRTDSQVASAVYWPLTGTEAGLLGYWRFDEGAGTNVSDATADGYTGVFAGGMNGPIWTGSTVPNPPAGATPPEWLYALSFNGGYVELGRAPVLGTNFTAEAWIKPQLSDNSLHGLLGNLFVTDGGNSLWIEDPNATYYFSARNVLESNVWSHVAVSYDGIFCRVYVNGQQVAISCIGTVPAWQIPYIGQVVGPCFRGQMDEVRLWNVARSQHQIVLTMRQPLTGTEPNLLAYWRFDEGGGLAVFDSTTNGYNGMLVNGMSWIASTVPPVPQTGWGDALSFDGVSGYVRLPSLGAALPTNEVTVEFWQRCHQAADTATFSVSQDNQGNRFSGQVLRGNGHLYWDFGNVGGDGRLDWWPSSPLPLDTWEHFAFVAKCGPGGYMQIYANGILMINQLRSSYPASFSGHDLLLGYIDSDTNFFNGQIDEFRIWNVARTQPQIASTMYWPLTGTESNLLAYWRFDEGDSTNVFDATANGHNGIFGNGTNGTSWTVSTVPQAPAPPSPWAFALSFNGVSDFVQMNASPLSPPWTAEFWVNREDSPAGSAALWTDDQGALKLEQGNSAHSVGLTQYGSGYSHTDHMFNYSTPADGWLHLAFVCDTNTRLYVNGLWQDTLPDTNALPMQNLGMRIPQSSDCLNAALSEVRVWNYARSQADIRANMTRRLTGKEPGLVAYYPLSEGGGTAAYDLTAKHNTGYLHDISNVGPTNGPTWVSSTLGNRWDWMSERLDFLGNRALKALVLPATHDSAMYLADMDHLQLSGTYSLSSYGCWFGLTPGDRHYANNTTVPELHDNILADVDIICSLEFIGLGVTIGAQFMFPSAGALEAMAYPEAQAYGLTQDRTIFEQLGLGVRYFDLRPKLEDGTWYIHHSESGVNQDIKKSGVTVTVNAVSLTGPLLDTVLTDVESFVSSHRELVILDISHYLRKDSNIYDQNFSSTDYQDFTTHLTSILGQYLFHSNSLPSGKRLGDVTLSEYLANTNHGTVLVVCDREGPGTDWPTKYPVDGIWPEENYPWTNNPSPLALRLYSTWDPNLITYHDVKTNALAKFQTFGSTPDTAACDLFSPAWGTPNNGTTPIYDLAEQENPLFASEMYAIPQPNPQGRIINTMSGDFVENSGAVDVAITMNMTPYRPTLRARWLTNQIELAISSVVGYQLLLQQTTNLASPAWTPVTTITNPITITNFPHVLTVPLPSGPQAYWRAVVN